LIVEKKGERAHGQGGEKSTKATFLFGAKKGKKKKREKELKCLGPKGRGACPWRISFPSKNHRRKRGGGKSAYWGIQEKKKGEESCLIIRVLYPNGRKVKKGGSGPILRKRS